MQTPLILDVIQSAHLLFFAVGMGPAIYFDLRSLNRIARPILQSDIEELHSIHRIVSCACLGLWLTGILLIWSRTGFQLSEFSPKLFGKLIVVTTLTTNAVVLAKFVIPALSRYTGDKLIDLPVRLLLPMTLCAGVSLACWLLALALGSSTVLKSANWDLLMPVLLGGGVACISSVLAIMFAIRLVAHRGDDAPKPLQLQLQF